MKIADEILELLDKSQRTGFDWRSIAFPKQVECIEDPHRLKVYFTTRRGAKSYTDGIELIKDATETPKCNCLYLGLTRLSAKAIIWKDVLKDISDKKNLGIAFHETELTATTKNGSVIYVAGVDVDENERKKLFGRKYKRIVIDEAALYSIDLRDLVYVTLRPATADLKGSITISGMSSNLNQGLFYDLTKIAPMNGPNGEPYGRWNAEGWSCHAWTAHDNPHIDWQGELDFIAQNQPLLTKTNTYRQAYLNHWVVDEDAFVYKYSDRNYINSLPQFDVPYSYVLGVDLGHSPDPSAFVVGAYTSQSPDLFIIHAEKHLKYDVTDVANKIKELEFKWKFDVKIVDNANAQAVAELNNRHGTNLIAADKTGKEDFINLMNAEFIQKKIFVLPGASELAREYKTLVWQTESGAIKKTPSGARKEHPGLPNHMTDAALYLWRHCHQYLFTKPELTKHIDWNKQEEWEPQHIEKMAEDIQRKQNPSHYDHVFQPDEGLFDFDQDDVI